MDEPLELAPAPVRWSSRLERAFAYYQRLGLVRDHLMQNIGSALTLAEAARIAGLNDCYFSDYFHRKTGICFRTWVSRVRVAHAAKLIAETDLAIREVAARSGFGDLRTFERAFRREMHTTPRDYRKSVQPG